MKKILTTILAGTVAAGVAFADFTVSGQVRFESDVFTYTSPSAKEHSQKWGKGDVNWAKDTKHAEDFTIAASGDNVGAKIVFTVSSNTDGSSNGGIVVKAYQGWVNDLFGLRLDAGTYDQRLVKNLANAGDWNTNLSDTYKPGIIANFGGVDDKSDAAWGKDAGNITNIKGSRNYTNFQVTKSGLLDGKLTLRGLLFLTKSGTDANGDSTNNDRWIFTPFALGATYAPDKSTQFALTAKLNSITKGKRTEGKDSLTVGDYKYYDKDKAKSKTDASSFNSIDDVISQGTSGGRYYESVDGSYTDNKNSDAGWYREIVYTKGTDTFTPDNSVYTVNFDFYKKLGSGIELEAAYTLGMSLYSNWSGAGARLGGHLVRDYDVFAHGVDFRVRGIRPVDALSLTAIANVSYVQGTAVQKATNRNMTTKDRAKYKDSLARSYATGAASKLAYFATVSADYQQSDTITFQVQAKLEDDNLFSVANGDNSNVAHVDYLEGMSLIVRPGIIVNVGGASTFFAGVQVTFDGFQQYATGDKNTFKVSAAVPVGMRLRL